MITACLIALRNVCTGTEGKTWKDLVRYETRKRVRINDPKVGVIRLVIVLSSFLYFAVWRIYFERGYEQREVITGIIQTSLKQPQLLPRTDQLSYCDSTSGKRSMTVLPCTTGPDAWMMAPSRGSEQLFIATRVKDLDSSGMVTSRSFTVQPEAYTIGITFTVAALGLLAETKDRAGFSKSIRDITTELVDSTGQSYTNGVTRIGRFDIIKVNTLLHAAGITHLDDPHAQDNTVSNRYDGVSIILSINCDMDHDGAISKCSYQATHMHRSASERFLVRNFNGSSTAGITTQERRGIVIRLEASGWMGRFHLPTLTLNWATAVAWVGVFSLVVDFLLVYILHYRKIYRLMIFDESPNIHLLRQGDSAMVKAVNSRDKHRRASRGEEVSPATSPSHGNAKVAGAVAAHQVGVPTTEAQAVVNLDEIIDLDDSVDVDVDAGLDEDGGFVQQDPPFIPDQSAVQPPQLQDHFVDMDATGTAAEGEWL